MRSNGFNFWSRDLKFTRFSKSSKTEKEFYAFGKHVNLTKFIFKGFKDKSITF